MDLLLRIWETTGFGAVTGKMVVMWAVVLVLLYLAVRKGFEPLLLVPIALGALLANLPTHGVMEGLVDLGFPLEPDGTGGLFFYISLGILLALFPPIIFLGVGALTAFGPLIANPRTLLLGGAALIFMLFLGNFLRECGVVERLSQAAQNEIINITTIFLGTSVGITMTAERSLALGTMKIIVMGVLAFAVSTAAGVLMARLMNVFSTNKINLLIGSAGVSAVPMPARVSQVEGQKADPTNYLLMHAMGPNMAGVIGTALVAGYFIATISR